MLLSRDTGVSRGFLAARYGFYAAVVAMFAWFGALHLLAMYWFVPLFTWLIVIFRVRSIAEHSAIEGRANAYAQTRSTRASVLDHIFVAPKNVNYHIEHHFYPSVPFYRLPELHRVLMSKARLQGVRARHAQLSRCAPRMHSRLAFHALGPPADSSHTPEPGQRDRAGANRALRKRRRTLGPPPLKRISRLFHSSC